MEILGLAETWYRPGDIANIKLIERKDFVQEVDKDTRGRSRRGMRVLAVVPSPKPSQNWSKIPLEGIHWALAVRLKAATIVFIYVPPLMGTKYAEELENVLQRFSNGPLIVIGDFNMHSADHFAKATCPSFRAIEASLNANSL